MVISGGQCGADLAGIWAAEICGIKTGGIAPLGYRTEKGKQPLLHTRFGLTEHPDWRYGPRTLENIANSDVTIILSPNKHSAGTALTIKECKKRGNLSPFRPHILIDTLNAENRDLVLSFLTTHKPTVINIAGNRESVAQGLTQQGCAFFKPIFLAYKQHLANEK